MSERDLPREDIEALLATRRELGPDYDAALVDAFAERIERAVAERVDAGGVAHQDRARSQVSERHEVQQRQFVLAILSLLACVPISIPLGLQDKFATLAVVLLTVVAINVCHALQTRPRP